MKVRHIFTPQLLNFTLAGYYINIYSQFQRIIKDETMQFNVKDWRRFYDRVKVLGKHYQDSQHAYDGTPPVRPISLETKIQLKQEIDDLIEKCKRYLDACNMRPGAPLWHYNLKDKRTWASHESFAYAHLMEF
jgi:hypothetical protein